MLVIEPKEKCISVYAKLTQTLIKQLINITLTLSDCFENHINGRGLGRETDGVAVRKTCFPCPR